MAETAGKVTLSDRDQLARLLRFLETDVGIGPGHEAKHRNMESQNLRQDRPPLSVVPTPLQTQRLHTAYMENWTHVPPWGMKKPSATLGGSPITVEMAIELRTLVCGSARHVFSKEWLKSTLEFSCLEGSFPYGLQTLKCGSSGLALCVQGYLLKHLIFDREYKSSILQGTSALSPNDFERRRALIRAICEMLWQAGDKRRCCVCLKDADCSFGPDHRYRLDSVTEKIHIFEFKKYEEVLQFVKRNLAQFQSVYGNGCILFLYSLILSRTIKKVYEDVQADHGVKVKLLTDMDDVAQSVLNLALTGTATPHTHNRELLFDRRGQLLPRSLHGINSRNQIGFLYWDKGENPDNRTEIGSMLKTPKNPIWVTKVNGLYGILFSLNADLVSHWRVEDKFTVFYYTGLAGQVKPAVLTVETRIGRGRPKTSLGRREEENKIPALENCIMMKCWSGASNMELVTMTAMGMISIHTLQHLLEETEYFWCGKFVVLGRNHHSGDHGRSLAGFNTVKVMVDPSFISQNNVCLQNAPWGGEEKSRWYGADVNWNGTVPFV